MAKVSKSADTKDTKKKISAHSKKVNTTEDMQEISQNLSQEKSDGNVDEKPYEKADEKASKEVNSSDIIYKKPVRLRL